jgi:hypothetical protein
MLRAVGALLLAMIMLPALADPSAADYQSLLAAAKRGDQSTDWRALRLAYAESADFDLLGVRTIALRKKMFAALQAEDFPGAARAAQRLLDVDFVDLDAHLVGELAYGKLGDAAQAKFHHDAVLGLMGSICTGDGQTPATAFAVISIGEEFEALRVLGLHRTQQTQLEENGHTYDRLEVVDKEGKAQSFFFLIDRVLASEAKAHEAR